MCPADTERDDQKRDPSTRRHLLFVGACWLLLPLVYWEDYGWPWEPPHVPYGGNWIVLDLTGLMTAAYLLFSCVYTALTTWIFVRARRQRRPVRWAEYVLCFPASLVVMFALWQAYLALN